MPSARSSSDHRCSTSRSPIVARPRQRPRRLTRRRSNKAPCRRLGSTASRNMRDGEGCADGAAIRLLRAYPSMPATVIAGRIGWDRGLTVLKDRIRDDRPVAPGGSDRGYEAAAKARDAITATYDAIAKLIG